MREQPACAYHLRPAQAKQNLRSPRLANDTRCHAASCIKGNLMQAGSTECSRCAVGADAGAGLGHCRGEAAHWHAAASDRLCTVLRAAGSIESPMHVSQKSTGHMPSQDCIVSLCSTGTCVEVALIPVVDDIPCVAHNCADSISHCRQTRHQAQVSFTCFARPRSCCRAAIFSLMSATASSASVASLRTSTCTHFLLRNQHKRAPKSQACCQFPANRTLLSET